MCYTDAILGRAPIGKKFAIIGAGGIGLHVITDGESRLLEVDAVIVCVGQESNNSFAISADIAHLHAIGGAELAMKIDARRAIDQDCRLAARL